MQHSTPDDSMNSSSSGLKFTFEAQPNSYATPSQTPDIKESPPSSPASEISQQRGGGGGGSSKRHANNSNSNSSSTTDAKEFKMFQKSATHMMGNQLNPASQMAQKMSDQLYMEMEAHSVYNNSANLEPAATLVGPTFPGKQLNNVCVTVAVAWARFWYFRFYFFNLSLCSIAINRLSRKGRHSVRYWAAPCCQRPAAIPHRVWNNCWSGNGNRAHNFSWNKRSILIVSNNDIIADSPFIIITATFLISVASLLSCLYQLRSENVRLEEHVNNLIARRDHLLAVNARLAIPLNQTSGGQPQGPGKPPFRI